MSKKIALGASPEAQVVLHDPDHDTGDRVYRLAPFTRSVKDRLRDLHDGSAPLRDELELLEADGKPMTGDVADRITRKLCDELNLVLTGGEDAPAPGDLLYDGYLADRVTDDQIADLHTALLGAVEDPT